MTLLPFLHTRLGFDAIYAQSVIVVLCGAVLQSVLVRMINGSFFGWDAGYGWLILASLAIKAALYVVAMLPAYGLIHGLCRKAGLAEIPRRLIPIAVAPLGAALAYPLWGFVMFGMMPGSLPSYVADLPWAALSLYLDLGLPLLAAGILAARKIRKTRVNAEAVFGGPP